jgi:hypothetical protein
MKTKIIVALAFIGVGFGAFSEDKVFSIASASGSLSQSITNTSESQRWYIKSLYGVASATNDTVTLYKVSNSVNIPVGSHVTGANSNVVISITTPVYLSPNEVMVVGRTITNTTLKGFVVVGEE